MIFRLIQSDALEPGEILLDKEEGIIFYKDMVDWFKFMEEYNNEDSSSSKE
jgi:hypothetical protein